MATIQQPPQNVRPQNVRPRAKVNTTPTSVKFFENKLIKIIGFVLWTFLMGLKIYQSVQEGRDEELAKWAGITKSVLVPVVYTLMGGGILLSSTQNMLRRIIIGAFLIFIVSMRMYTNIKEGRGEDPPKWVSAFNSSFNFIITIAMIVFGLFIVKGQNRVRLLLLGILFAMDTGLDFVKLIRPPETNTVSEPEPAE